MGLVLEPRAATEAERIADLRLIDTDVHNDLPSQEELRPFLAKKWHPAAVRALLARG